MEGEDLGFKYILDKSNISSKLVNTAGSFVKIGNDIISIQPKSRRLLIPHVGYPSNSDACAISITRSDDTTMGSFNWDVINVLTFDSPENFTFISDSSKYTSWFPEFSSNAKLLHARLYNLTNVPGEYYINALLGTSDETTIVSTTAGTIKTNTTINNIPDVPYIMSNGTLLWFTSPMSIMDLRGYNADDYLAGISSVNYYSRYSGINLPTIASTFMNCNETTRLAYNVTDSDSADYFFMGYLNDLSAALDYINNDNNYLHIKDTSSGLNKHIFLNINIKKPYYRCNNTSSAFWYSNSLEVCVPEEIDHIDNGHVELVDGMWIDINYTTA